MPFATASETVPEPCQVAGTPLRPFCLGHHLLFKRMGLPLCGNALAAAGADEFAFGIVICAARYEETLEAMLMGDWPGMVRRWRRSVLKRSIFGRRMDWAGAELLFRAYLQDGYKRPPIRRWESKNGLELTAPEEVMLKCELVRAGFSETEVLNGYLPARWYDFYTVRELQNAATCSDPAKWRRVFWTEEDEKRREENPT